MNQKADNDTRSDNFHSILPGGCYHGKPSDHDPSELEIPKAEPIKVRRAVLIIVAVLAAVIAIWLRDSLSVR